jgi:hypothetical protein
MTHAQLEQTLPGTSFPPGRYTIEPWAQMLLCDLFDLPQAPDGSGHPLFAYLGTQVGIGIGVDGIMALARTTVDDGVMMASCEVELMRPLHPGLEYGVTGGVVALEHKEGRRTGPFDLMTFALELTEAGGESPAARVTNVWVLPRRSSGDV